MHERGDEAVGAVAVRRWGAGVRVGFRFVFCYFLQFVFGSGHKTVLGKIPFVGRRVEAGLEWPYAAAARWVGVHVFHLTGAAAVRHFSGFADRALDWIAAGLMVAIALLATIVWTVVDRRRVEYADLMAWLRFGLRLTVAVAMLWYGSIKLFPMQVEPPSLAVLHEPVGNMSPMTMLWTLLGSNPGYERVCGAMETLCAVLLLFRRTALMGALLSLVVMSNVVLFNYFFDVPVKLYATNLLLMCVVLVAPDVRAMWDFFLSRKACVPRSLWVPPVGRRAFKIATLLIELGLVLVLVKPFFSHEGYARAAAAERNPSKLVGQWHLVGGALTVNDGAALTDLFLEPTGRVTAKGANDVLWGTGFYDEREVGLTTYLGAGVGYSIREDAGGMVLVPKSGGVELRFVRVDIPLHYRLYDRGFHLVSEWGFEQ